jgi:hypothetical protein
MYSAKETPPGYHEALQTLHKSYSPRYKRLDRLERYVKGSQYDHCKSGWLDDDDVPLLDRAPHVVEPVGREAIESYQDLLLGEERWPTLTTSPDEDDDDEELGLSEEQGKLVDKLIRRLEKAAELPSVACEALGKGLGCGTAVANLGVVAGVPVVENLRAKHCWPEWDKDDPDKLVALEVKYPYLVKGEGVGDSKMYAGRVKCMWYRRRIDEQSDTVFKPARGKETGDEPEPDKWVVDKQINHGYGFCPVVWWACGKKHSDEEGDGDDGYSLHGLLLNEQDALNRSCSQHDRAALYAGDPQWIEKNVARGYNPAPGGRSAALTYNRQGKDGGPESPEVRAAYRQWQEWPFRGGGGGAKRRKGPGVVWTYEAGGPAGDPDARMETLPGDALDAVAKNRDALRALCARAMAWVDLDGDDVMGPRGGTSGLANLSGAALTQLKRRQLDRCDKLRVDFGNRWLKPVVSMLLRIVLHHVIERPNSLFLKGATKLDAGINSSFYRDVVDPVDPDETVREWIGPELTLKWPPYFLPNAQDAATASKQVREDLKAGLITRRTAVEKLAPFYDIDDIDAYLDELEKEDEQRAERKERENHGIAGALAGLKPAAPALPGQPPAAKAPPPPAKAPPPKPKKA